VYNEMLRDCLSCGSNQLQESECVSIDAVASAWARERVHCEDTSASQLRQYIQDDTVSQTLKIWKCDMCRLEMADPLRSWSAAHYPVANDEIGFDHLIALKDLADAEPQRILDIGCGDGVFLQRAMEQRHEVVGLDFSEDDVELVRAKGIEAQVADLKNFKTCFASQQMFDVITMFQIIEHLTDPHQTMSDIEAIAAPHAVLYIGCPSDLRFSRFLPHPRPLTANDFWDYPPQHVLRWTHTALEAFLSRHHWRVEWIRYEPFSAIAAASYMSALHGRAEGWYERPVRRKLGILTWLLRVATSRLIQRMTGIRMILKAHRDLQLVGGNHDTATMSCLTGF
jgi:2-polyprenyl-3-methyl-5-hydroxy-6-metoxy-1,4-benzoquinol methylase